MACEGCQRGQEAQSSPDSSPKGTAEGSPQFYSLKVNLGLACCSLPPAAPLGSRHGAWVTSPSGSSLTPSAAQTCPAQWAGDYQGDTIAGEQHPPALLERGTWGDFPQGPQE